MRITLGEGGYAAEWRPNWHGSSASDGCERAEGKIRCVDRWFCTCRNGRSRDRNHPGHRRRGFSICSDRHVGGCALGWRYAQRISTARNSGGRHHLARRDSLVLLYVWLLEGLLGATLGKFILNLRVRRLDGSGIGLSKSLVRNLSRVVDAIGVYLVGFLIANFSNRKQRLGDHLAGTVVVHGDSGKVTRAIAAVAWAAIIIACFVKAYALHPSGTSAQAAPLPLVQSTPQTSPVIAPAQTAPMQNPSPAPSPAAVTRAEMGTGKTDDYKIVNPSVEFYTDTPEIVCVWDVAGVDPSVPIKSIWVADDVGAAAPPNYKIVEKTLVGYSEGSFSMTSPNGGWPVGQYHLEIYIGDKLAKQIPFTIKQR